MVKQCPIYTLENVTCPCCFANFPITDLKIRDSKNNLNLLVPDRFTYNGVPCDQDGIEVNNYVCPNCAFDIPIRFLEHSTYYISMVGAPNTGKTYYSASMYYEILKLAEGYPITVTRADIMTNDTLGTYYRALYRTHEEQVYLEKTQANSSVHYHNGYPKPYIFEIQPSHKDLEQNVLRESFGQGIFLNVYDQAGEDWDDPHSSSKKFGHLRHPNGILFVFFDPCQDISESKLPPWELVRLLKDRCQRVNPKVFVLATKLDRWANVLIDQLRINRMPIPAEINRLLDPKNTGNAPKFESFAEIVKYVSQATMQCIDKRGEDYRRFINALNDLSADVTWFPISSTGCQPEVTNEGEHCFRRRSLNPSWVRMPVLYALKNNPASAKFLEIHDISSANE